MRALPNKNHDTDAHIEKHALSVHFCPSHTAEPSTLHTLVGDGELIQQRGDLLCKLGFVQMGVARREDDGQRMVMLQYALTVLGHPNHSVVEKRALWAGVVCVMRGEIGARSKTGDILHCWPRRHRTCGG